jgi:hypothetical protein
VDLDVVSVFESIFDISLVQLIEIMMNKVILDQNLNAGLKKVQQERHGGGI